MEPCSLQSGRGLEPCIVRLPRPCTDWTLATSPGQRTPGLLSLRPGEGRQEAATPDHAGAGDEPRAAQGTATGSCQSEMRLEVPRWPPADPSGALPMQGCWWQGGCLLGSRTDEPAAGGRLWARRWLCRGRRGWGSRSPGRAGVDGFCVEGNRVPSGRAALHRALELCLLWCAAACVQQGLPGPQPPLV